MTDEEFALNFPEFSTPVAPSPVSELQKQLDDINRQEKAAREEAEPDFFTKFFPEIAEISGAIAGAAGASKYAPGILKVPAAVYGGVVGATTARTAGEVTQDVMLDNEVDVVDAIAEGLKAGTFEALGAGIFSAVGKGFKTLKAIRAGKKPTPEDIAELRELDKAMQESGIKLPNGEPVRLTPAQITGSKAQTTLEKISIAGLTVGTNLKDLYEAQAKALQSIFDSNIALIGKADRKAAGEAFQNAIQQTKDEVAAWAGPKYKELDKLASSTPISFQSTEQWVRNKILASGKMMPSNKGKTASVQDLMSMSTRLPDYQEKFLKQLLDNDRTLSFDVMFDLQRKALKEVAKEKKALDRMDGDKIQFFSEVASQLGKNMETQAKKAGTDVYKQYQEINKTYKAAMDLSDDAVSQLSKDAPEFVGEHIATTGNVTLVENAFKAIDDAAALAKQYGTPFDPVKIKQDLKAGYVNSLLSKVMADMKGEAVEKASTVLGKLRTDLKSSDTFKAMLSKEEQGQLMKVLGWSEKLNKETAGNFSLMIRGKQSQALRQIVRGLSGVSVAGGYVGLGAVGAVTAAIGAVAAPSLIARWAVSGKATNKALGQIEDVIKAVNEGKKLSGAAIAGFVALVASMPLRYEDLPDLEVKDNMTAGDALMFQFIEGDYLEGNSDAMSGLNNRNAQPPQR